MPNGHAQDVSRRTKPLNASTKSLAPHLVSTSPISCSGTSPVPRVQRISQEHVGLSEMRSRDPQPARMELPSFKQRSAWTRQRLLLFVTPVAMVHHLLRRQSPSYLRLMRLIHTAHPLLCFRSFLSRCLAYPSGFHLSLISHCYSWGPNGSNFPTQLWESLT